MCLCDYLSLLFAFDFGYFAFYQYFVFIDYFKSKRCVTAGMRASSQTEHGLLTISQRQTHQTTVSDSFYLESVQQGKNRHSRRNIANSEEELR